MNIQRNFGYFFSHLKTPYPAGFVFLSRTHVLCTDRANLSYCVIDTRTFALYIFIKGAGYIILRYVFQIGRRKKLDPEGVFVIITGIVFWLLAGICGYLYII